MPQWIHDRAEHILAKNPSMPKSEAFAIATQQAHSMGKSPNDYGTRHGRAVAKHKYDTPSDDKKTANPGRLESPKMASAYDVISFQSFADELQKIAGFMFGGPTANAPALPNAAQKATMLAAPKLPMAAPNRAVNPSIAKQVVGALANPKAGRLFGV